MKIFYGWRMVAAAAAIQFMQAMMLYQAFGAYFAVLIQENGWSKTSVSGAAALQSAEAALMGPVLGWFIDRFGAQGVIKIGVLTFGVGFMLLSQIDSLPGLYGAIAVIALGSSMCGYFPLNVAVIQWFEKKRARALSMVGLGLAVGGVFVPIVAWAIQTFGWRWAAFGSGVVVIVLGYPLAQVFRRRPEDFGETIDGLPVAAKSAVGSPPASQNSETGNQLEGPAEFTARQAIRTRAFWLLSLGHGVALLVVTAVNVHAINHMKNSLGFSIAQASLVITLMTAAQVVGVLIGGAIGDKTEKRRIAAICMLMHAAGLLMLTYAGGYAMLLAFALLHGTAWGLRGPFMQAIRADYFGRRSIGMILGLSALITALGQVSGPLLAGVLGDATGDYRLGFSVLAAIAALGSLLFWFAKRPQLSGSGTTP